MNSISIVLCTCNGERFLDEQLTTLRQQEGVAEILVADDQSTDDTMTILHEHAMADPRIRICRSERRLGVTRNFERALGLARSEWLALSDQDDIWLSHKIATLRAAWDGESVLVHHATHKFATEPARVLPSPAGQSRKFFGNDVRRLLYRNTVVGHTLLIRADVARHVMPFPLDVPYDWWLGATATLYGKVQYVDEFLVHYRIHDHNAYHPKGSRFARLRAEYKLRLNLLRRLEELPRLPDATQRFVRVFLAELLAAETVRFPWRLGRFYLQHAPLFFGGANRSLSRWTRVRKSFAATCGAVAQRPTETASLPRRAAARLPLRRPAGWWSLGLGVVSAASVIAIWPGKAENKSPPATPFPPTPAPAVSATENVSVGSGSMEVGPPPMYLFRNDRVPPWAGAPAPAMIRRLAGMRPPGPPPLWAARRPFPLLAIAGRSRFEAELRYLRSADRGLRGHFRPVFLQRNLPRGLAAPLSGAPYTVLIRRPFRI